jgi:branched-chain amino acid transport system ATP-binding protein
MSDIILAIDSLSKNFGGVHAVQSVSLAISGGRIFSVIGPNGAGKTTLINLLTGILASSGGRVRFEDRDITDAPAHLVASAGMVRTFRTAGSSAADGDGERPGRRPPSAQSVWSAWRRR